MRRYLFAWKALSVVILIGLLAVAWLLVQSTEDTKSVPVDGVSARMLSDAHIVLEQPTDEDRAQVTTTADDARQLALAWTTYPQEVEDVVLARYQQLEEHCLCWVVSLDSGSPPRKFSDGPARPEGIPSPTPRTATGWLTFYLVDAVTGEPLSVVQHTFYKRPGAN